MTERVHKPETRVFVILLALLGALCAFLTQPNKNYNNSPLSWLSSKAGEKFSTSFSRIQLNNYQSHILILAALAVVFAVRTIYRYMTGRPPAILAVYTLFLGFMLATLYIGIKKSFSERFALLLICVSIAFPLILDVIICTVSPEHASDSYVWLIISVVFAVFLKSNRTPQVFFKIFICALFAGIISEIYFIDNLDIAESLEMISNVLSAGFVIFASLSFYKASSTQNYLVLEDIYKELKDTQAQLTQREQMVTLGQLIAGVAHEINTPIGAIKSSSEALAAYDLGGLLKEMRHYSDDDLDAMMAIMDICSKSVKNMRSTAEIRRGRAQVVKYLESVNVEDAKNISAVLSSMDICDIEKIADNIDFFRHENIMEVIHGVRGLYTYISSVQNIQFASAKVAKIVFALKSFSHMNFTGEECEFDVVRNIDNVLVLYQNQLKRGVEIVKIYDDDIPLVYGNVEEISQVWTNIAQNAIYAMSFVGELTISIKVLGDFVEVSFSDTGTGISPENIKKIFTPFFTTKPLGEGSGLGLDICKKIINKHNGDIKVESKLGQGSTFIVTLPVKRELGMNVL